MAWASGPAATAAIGRNEGVLRLTQEQLEAEFIVPRIPHSVAHDDPGFIGQAARVRTIDSRYSFVVRDADG
jgi:hypothetical protein